MLSFIFFSFLFDMFFFLLKQLKKMSFKLEMIQKIGVFPFLFSFVVILFGFFNMQKVVMTEYDIYSHKLERDYRVLFLSDLHFPTTMDQNKLDQIVRQMSSYQPDFVILGGDIVDEETDYQEMEQVFQSLSQISNRYGIYYVYGNHDKANSIMGRDVYTVDQLNETIWRNQIKILADDVIHIENDILLIGRKNANESRLSTKEILNNEDLEQFLFLIDHYPKDVVLHSEMGIDLQISGHTHAGQVFPAGFLIRWMGNIDYGYQTKNALSVIVSSGLGGWDFPIRTSAHSEFVILNLKAT